MVRVKEFPGSREPLSDDLSLQVGFGVPGIPKHRRWVLHVPWESSRETESGIFCRQRLLFLAR